MICRAGIKPPPGFFLRPRGSIGRETTTISRSAFTMKNPEGSIASEFWILKSRAGAVGSRSCQLPMTTQSSAQLASTETPLWFCLRTQPKHEHLAAIALRRQLGIACFSLARVSVKRPGEAPSGSSRQCSQDICLRSSSIHDSTGG